MHVLKVVVLRSYTILTFKIFADKFSKKSNRISSNPPTCFSPKIGFRRHLSSKVFHFQKIFPLKFNLKSLWKSADPIEQSVKTFIFLKKNLFSLKIILFHCFNFVFFSQKRRRSSSWSVLVNFFDLIFFNTQKNSFEHKYLWKRV